MDYPDNHVLQKQPLGSFLLFKFENRSRTTFLFSSLRIGREQHVLDSSHHSPCLRKLFNSRHTAQHSTAQHTPQRSKRREERKMKEKSGQSRCGYNYESHGFSCHLSALVLNWFLTTLTCTEIAWCQHHFRPSLKNKNWNMGRRVAHMPAHTLTFRVNHYPSHHCFSQLSVSPGNPGTFQYQFPGERQRPNE